ncbi:TIR domain-containing protein [Bradyrhizobium sp. Ai1a-2]|uniref:toll/interleukin-1 receptor domain-containing protein n=1 Tax=Bradyrhizobium sp. Ai1a-2 TaxID=196490 RepID=UPI0004171D87|nr:TIR domain-containing protein [Bradyrhizobium sp. Ai1a-2]
MTPTAPVDLHRSSGAQAAVPELLAAEGLIKVFISYSRHDAPFVEQLGAALRARGIDAWIDRREITPTADWLQRIVQGIVQSTFFIFVVSPRSVASEVCAVELRHAVELNKPLVPVILAEAAVPDLLQAVQWCDFRDPAAFDAALTSLEAALRRDPEWLAIHGRLAAAATEWQARKRPWAALLHGGSITEAMQWLAAADGVRRRPTELQRTYVHASRLFSARWKQVSGAVVAVLLVIAGLGFWAEQRRAREGAARELANRALQLRTADQGALTESTLMLVEAVRELADLGQRSPDIDAMLREGMRMLLRPRAVGEHPNGVGGMAVALDGKSIATFAFGTDVSAVWNDRSDSTVRLWDVPASTPVATLPHPDPVRAAAFDGRGGLVTGTVGGLVSFWNLQKVRSGAPASERSIDLGAPVGSIAAQPSGAVAAGTGGKLCAWDVETHSQRWCAEDTNGEGLLLVALSPDGGLVASGGQKGSIEIREMPTGKVVRTLHHRSGAAITSLAFSPGANQLASGDDKGELHVWTMPDGDDQYTVAHRDAVTAVTYSASSATSPFVVTVSKDRSIRILDWSMFDAWRVEEFKTDYALWRVAVDPGGRFVAVARGDGFVDLLGRQEGKLVGRVRIPSGDVATGLSFLPGDLLAVVDGGQGVRFLEVTAGTDAWVENAAVDLDHMAMSASGVLLGADFAGTGYVLGLANGRPRPLVPAPALPPVGALAFAPFGDRVAVVDDHAQVLRVLAWPSGRELAQWPVEENVGAVTWHPGRDVVAVARRDANVRLYEVPTGRLLDGTDAGATALSFSADGTWLAFVVPYQGLRLWRWGVGGKPVAPAGTGDVRLAVFSPSAALLLTASNSGVVRASKISDGEAGLELRQAWAAAPCAEPTALVVSRDGSLAAAGCEDGRIRLFIVATGVAISELHYPGKLATLAFSPEGAVLLAGGDNGLRGFLVSGVDLVQEACSRVSRNLTMAEWQRDLGARACRPTCPGLPACG